MCRACIPFRDRSKSSTILRNGKSLLGEDEPVFSIWVGLQHFFSGLNYSPRQHLNLNFIPRRHLNLSQMSSTQSFLLGQGHILYSGDLILPLIPMELCNLSSNPHQNSILSSYLEKTRYIWFPHAYSCLAYSYPTTHSIPFSNLFPLLILITLLINSPSPRS